MFNYNKYSEIEQKIQDLQEKTKIIAISKNHPFEVVEEAILKGIRVFGENRVQEAKTKFNNILKENKKIELHLTGPLQTNKVKIALSLFDVFHTVDREKLVKELCKFPNIIEKKSFFIQVNTGKEKTKSGVNPEDTPHFLKLCKQYGLNNIAGLMCIPPVDQDPTKHFRLINNLTKDLSLGRPSIGMSSDYLSALEFSPQYIRLGTLLFGNRK